MAVYFHFVDDFTGSLVPALRIAVRGDYQVRMRNRGVRQWGNIVYPAIFCT